MTTTTEIYAGFATALETIQGLQRMYTGMPDSLNEPPAGVLIPVELDPLIDMGGNHKKYTVQLIIFVSSGNSIQAWNTAQNFLDDSGANSVIAAIEADQTLGGTVDCAFVRSGNAVLREAFGGGDWVAVDFLIEYWRTS